MPGPIYGPNDPMPPYWPYGQTEEEKLASWEAYKMRRIADRAMDPNAPAPLPAPPPLVPAYPGIETWEDREINVPPVSAMPLPLPYDEAMWSEALMQQQAGMPVTAPSMPPMAMPPPAMPPEHPATANNPLVEQDAASHPLNASIRNYWREMEAKYGPNWRDLLDEYGRMPPSVQPAAQPLPTLPPVAMPRPFIR